jgi:glycosyltransferase involved in cell wall biosynthesis
VNRSNKPIRITCLIDAPSPYNAFFFRALAADDEVDLRVRFIRNAAPEHPWSTSLTDGYDAKPLQKVAGLDWQFLGRDILGGRDRFVVVAGWYEINSRLALMLRGRRSALWTDTPKVTVPSRIRGLVRASLLRALFNGRAGYVMGTGKPAMAALQAMGAPSDKLVNFPFYVPLPADWNRERVWPAEDQPLHLLSIGRLDIPLKRYDVALQALARVRASMPNIKLQYHIAGTGAHEAKIRAQADVLGLSDMVKFHGWLEPPAIDALLARSHILLHPAENDPFPVVVLQSMAAGLVVMGSDTAGSVVDRVQHGVNGFIHRTGSADELAAQLESLVGNRQKLPELSAAARRTAEQYPVARGVELWKRLARENHS